jgi:small subunit ribosomal protein S17
MTKKIEQKNEKKETKQFKEKKVLSRGKTFEGKVIRKFPKRIVIEFERMKYVRKYERYTKSRTRIHARVPEKFENEINLGDLIKIQECRPLSKIIHFIVIEKIKSFEDIK